MVNANLPWDGMKISERLDNLENRVWALYLKKSGKGTENEPSVAAASSTRSTKDSTRIPAGNERRRAQSQRKEEEP